MYNIADLNHKELLEMGKAIDERIKRFRPVRIKKRWKRCGKKTCFCVRGPSDGSWGNLHGPYVFAQYVDRRTLKMRVVSLGTHYDDLDRQDVENDTLLIHEYFTVTPYEKEEMSEANQASYRWYIDLSEERFENFYGLKMCEDRMDRPVRFYGTDANQDAYEARERQMTAEKEAINRDWCVLYGIGSPEGQRKLADILSRDYYLVP